MPCFFLLFALLAAKCALVVAVPTPHHAHHDAEAIPGHGGNADGGSPSSDPKAFPSLLNYDYCDGASGGNSGLGGSAKGGSPQNCQPSLINIASVDGGPGGSSGLLPKPALIELTDLPDTDTTSLLNLPA